MLENFKYMNKKLYLVEYINQETGNTVTEYILCAGLAKLEEEIDDIISIKPISYEEIN